MTYIPPPVALPALSGGNPLLVKKKTKKAFVPGFADDAKSHHSGVSSIAQSPARRFQQDDITDPNKEAVARVEINEQDVEEHISTPKDQVSEIIVTPHGEVEEDVESHQGDLDCGFSQHKSYEDEVKEDVIVASEISQETNDAGVKDVIVSSESQGELLQDRVGESEIIELSKREMELKTEKTILHFRLNELESKQSDLCSSELFEEAELVESEISLVRASLYDLNCELFYTIPNRIAELDAQILAGRNTEVMETAGLVARLVEERDGRKLELETARESLLANLEKIKQVDLLFREKDLELEARENELEEKADLIEHEISEQSAQIELEKSQAETEYLRLDAVVQDLQNQLALAVSQRSECSVIISGNDLKLKNIRVQFSRQLDELDEDMAGLREAKESVVRDKRAQGGGDLGEAEKLIADVDEEIESISNQKDEINEMERRIENFEFFFSEKKVWKSKLEILKAEIEPVRKSSMEACELTNLLKEGYRDSERKLDTFRARISALRHKVPELEAEKKAAIADRAFKEAKELSNDLKSVIEEIEGSEAQLNELKQVLKSNRSELNRAIQAENDLRLQLEKSETEFSIAFSNHLSEKYETILRLIDQHEDDSSSLIHQLQLEKQLCEIHLFQVDSKESI